MSIVHVQTSMQMLLLVPQTRNFSASCLCDGIASHSNRRSRSTQLCKGLSCHFFPIPDLPFLAGAPAFPLLFSGSFLFPVSDFLVVTAPKKLSRRPTEERSTLMVNHGTVHSAEQSLRRGARKSPCVDLDLAALTRCTAFRTRSSLKLFSPTRNFTSPSSSAAIHLRAGTWSPLSTDGSAHVGQITKAAKDVND